MITELSEIMSVSGFEHRAADKIRELYAPYFDEIMTDRVGNHTLIKRCGREDAPKILIDAHFDEVGMLVSDVLEGGFLRIVNIGGIDPAIMQAADVVVYGKENLRGIGADPRSGGAAPGGNDPFGLHHSRRLRCRCGICFLHPSRQF